MDDVNRRRRRLMIIAAQPRAAVEERRALGSDQEQLARGSSFSRRATKAARAKDTDRS
jgi:hypothetical protein